jgi:hypothetical protein
MKLEQRRAGGERKHIEKDQNRSAAQLSAGKNQSGHRAVLREETPHPTTISSAGLWPRTKLGHEPKTTGWVQGRKMNQNLRSGGRTEKAHEEMGTKSTIS